MRILVLFILANLGHHVHCQNAHENLENGIALHGFDVVSYYEGEALLGVREFKYTYLGATYQFHNKSNLQHFKDHPEKYKVEFGGWCAYAMGLNGEKVDINPKTFKIINGKLYLFYNANFNNTLNKWNKDEKNLLSKAELNWKKLKK